MFIFLLIILIFSILLEGTVTTLPLTFLVLLVLGIMKHEAVFPIAFAAGIFLDVLTLRTIGSASLFFVIALLLILLYQRKYEINSYGFVGVAAGIGSLLFLILFGYEQVIVQSLLSSVLAVLLFGGIAVSQKSNSKNKKYK